MLEVDTFETNERRYRSWSRLTGRGPEASQKWDVIVIGGGITGAGILREAARRGLKAALIEQQDFAWGTSSRSSKMVHGGLRYLLGAHLKLTRDSVRERERLLRESPGLIDPLGFLFSNYKGKRPGRFSMNVLLITYDLFARRWNHRYYPAHEYTFLVPWIRLSGLKGGSRYGDAVTDDSRLVLRVIQEAQRDGALALNYVKAENLITKNGRVCGVHVRDVLSGETAEIPSRTVVNATGAWADRLRRQVAGGEDIRPLRGSHLVFPYWRIPIAQAVGLMHPIDGRPVFFMPWEGATIVGSTDLDHDKDLDFEARITRQEVDYLMEIVDYQFPSLEIKKGDILSTFSGIRPVISGGAVDPSKEKRDHSIWVEKGLISVSGGKLTTFRLIALDVLRHVARFIPELVVKDVGEPVFRMTSSHERATAHLDCSLRRRLAGHYGEEAGEVVKCAKQGELERVPGTDTLWVELRWALGREAVVHLDDLLLRRTRLGMLLPEGGVSVLDYVKNLCREVLGWKDERWHGEDSAYRSLWRKCYSVPGTEEIQLRTGSIPT